MFRKSTFALVAIAALSLSASAQSPTPIVVQAANAPVPATAGQAVAGQPASSTASAEAALKTLLQVKAANEEILRKQAATLLQLEEMEKSADQIKIYTKRG